MTKEKYEKLDKIINKSIDKIKESSVKNITNNHYENDEDEKYLPYKNMGVFDISDLYDQQYNFDNDESIIDSFQKFIKNMI